MTTRTLEPVSSTYRLEPTSRVCEGAPLAIPTLERVVNPTSVLLNDTVFEVTFPFFTAASRSKSKISSATAPESMTSLVVWLYARIVILRSPKSVRWRRGVM